MTTYSIDTIQDITGGKLHAHSSHNMIEHLVYDTRDIQQPAVALFFALTTAHSDGHRFIPDAYKKGIRNFIVANTGVISMVPQASVIVVDNVLNALQKIAAWHRSHFHYPVIGITGSNGKTIVKEWLTQMLSAEFRIVRSPKSFNSQIGVPVSVWQMSNEFNLGIFEAGISQAGEMENLQPIISPTLGVLTNIGDAHNEGFSDTDQKLSEKQKLFATANRIVCRDKDIAHGNGERFFRWGSSPDADLVVDACTIMQNHSEIDIQTSEWKHSLIIPFTDEASIENALTCCAVLVAMNFTPDQLKQKLGMLHPVEMRLQLKHSFNSCLIVNDSYSADITSLNIALHFQRQQSSGLSRTVILSEFVETGMPDSDLYRLIAQMLEGNGVSRIIAIGEKTGTGIGNYLPPEIRLEEFGSTAEFIQNFRTSVFANEIILIKGARRFGFERIAALFEIKQHQTVLEIDLNAVAHNFKEYKKLAGPHTRIMAMVKAFAYGSGGAEIAGVLQFHHVDFLGVAYADEGVDLVKAGINTPIMVMNPDASSFQPIVDKHLQPVIYSMELFDAFEQYVQAQGLQAYPVHIEIETGMNRLGFSIDEVEGLGMRLHRSDTFAVQSVFSHLAASEDPHEDDFTRLQASILADAVARLRKFIPATFLMHISNSAAIVRHPDLKMDMVRLGIGLYGIEIDNEDKLDLKPVATLRSTVAQIKHLSPGESVSYNRRGIVRRQSVIATVRIGYADGYARGFGNGVGKMLVNGRLAPVIGTVCMDMTMIDITDIPGVRVGDDVIVFGKRPGLAEVARWINTIPYEMMTSISQRIRRIYFHE